MNKKNVIFSLVIMCFLTISLTPAFGRSMITGKVVDAVSGEPIEGAAVYIHWSKTKGPPGLTSSVRVETAEALSDIEGNFKVPKYSTWLKNYTMAVYKKGYVCWSNKKIFPSSFKVTYYTDREHSLIDYFYYCQ